MGDSTVSLSFSLCLCFCVSLCHCLSVSLSVSLCVSVCLSVSICLSVCLSVENGKLISQAAAHIGLYTAVIQQWAPLQAEGDCRGCALE